jgi:hypothetical protein
MRSEYFINVIQTPDAAIHPPARDGWQYRQLRLAKDFVASGAATTAATAGTQSSFARDC